MRSLQVFAVDLSDLVVPPPTWPAVLSADERHMAANLARPQDRLSYVAAHALLRLTLADKVPGNVRFVVGPWGKPELAEGGWQFNLSHTDGMAAVALSATGPVGVDVERINPALTDPTVATEYFTPDEIAELHRQPDWSAAFTDLWTAKEAIIKAEGLGLGQQPQGDWHVWQCRPTPDHCLAMAYGGAEQKVDFQILISKGLTKWIATHILGDV